MAVSRHSYKFLQYQPRNELHMFFVSMLTCFDLPRRHVFSDIRAYICTSKECGMLMFDSFNTWRSHEMDHRREWNCSLCALSCEDEPKARTHLITCHRGEVDQLQVDTLLKTSSRSPEYLHAADCPFCDWSLILQKRNTISHAQDLLVPSRRFMKHIGKHLEDLALFVVPQPDENDEDMKDIGSNEVHVSGFDCPIRAGPNGTNLCTWPPRRDILGFPTLARVKFVNAVYRSKVPAACTNYILGNMLQVMD